MFFSLVITIRPFAWAMYSSSQSLFICDFLSSIESSLSSFSIHQCHYFGSIAELRESSCTEIDSKVGWRWFHLPSGIEIQIILRKNRPMCYPTILSGLSSYREWHKDIFPEIETMIKMHSINLKMITEQIFCLVNMSFITKFVIFNLKTG